MTTSDGRQSWDETWLLVATVVADRSRCANARVGAVVTTADNRVNSTGYNGPPRGLPVEGDCSNWCPHSRGEAPPGAPSSVGCTSVHAEMNALLRADATTIEGGTLYCTRIPCLACARCVANSGLARVVARVAPEDDLERSAQAAAYLRLCGLEVQLV